MSYKLLLVVVLVAISGVTRAVAAVTFFDVETVSVTANTNGAVYAGILEKPVNDFLVASYEESESMKISDEMESPVKDGVLSLAKDEVTKDISKAITTPVIEVSEESLAVDSSTAKTASVFTVPFFSQFTDISLEKWRKVGCGIASLAMLIDYYEPQTVSVDELLSDGIAEGAYLTDAGWSHAGLIRLSQQFGLHGESHSMANSSMDEAFAKLENVLAAGPVMASVHYTFDPKNPIPHLVVVNGVAEGKVYYNDPAEKAGGGSISIAKFQSAWKKRYIEIRPV